MSARLPSCVWWKFMPSVYLLSNFSNTSCAIVPGWGIEYVAGCGRNLAMADAIFLAQVRVSMTLAADAVWCGWKLRQQLIGARARIPTQTRVFRRICVKIFGLYGREPRLMHCCSWSKELGVAWSGMTRRFLRKERSVYAGGLWLHATSWSVNTDTK